MLLREKVIGRVKERHSHPDAKLGDLMVAHYKWQRGRKLGKPHPLDHTLYELSVYTGEGRFGKVYECLNLTSGEINAVKQVSPSPTPYVLLPWCCQISIQEKDSSTVQTILDEINVFQRLKHKNIVKFYGVEIHHVSTE